MGGVRVFTVAVVLVALVGWFGYRAWVLRDVWAGIYVLHDRKEPEEKRLQAAYRLSRDSRMEQSHLWELSLRRGLPDLARLVMADGISDDLVAGDPQGYVSAVARSPDWPAWLRLALARPLAYAATRGHAISRERLGELCRLDDPVLRLWALFALAVQPRPDPQTLVEIEQVARTTTPEHELAEFFLDAVHTDEPHRLPILDRATTWTWVGVAVDVAVTVIIAFAFIGTIWGFFRGFKQGVLEGLEPREGDLEHKARAVGRVVSGRRRAPRR